MFRILPVLLVAAALSTSAFAQDAKVRTCSPPFPYSCETVRWAVKVFSKKYLEEQGRKRGITACQRATAIACINGAK